MISDIYNYIVTYLLGQRTWSGPEWQRRLRSGSFYICLVHWQASMLLYVVPTHMTAAYISSAHSTVKLWASLGTSCMNGNVVIHALLNLVRYLDAPLVLVILGILDGPGWSSLSVSGPLSQFEPAVSCWLNSIFSIVPQFIDSRSVNSDKATPTTPMNN